jgi:hypothetical protein
MTWRSAARNEAPNPEIAHPHIAVADMPLVIPLLLYLGCAAALMAAGGIGLAVLLEPEGSRFPDAAARAGTVGVAPVEEFMPRAVDAPPAWIAPTPKYDLPTPPIAKRAVEAARKAAERQQRAKAARQRRDRSQPPGMSDDASSAYGFAGRPRLFFHPGMP